MGMFSRAATFMYFSALALPQGLMDPPLRNSWPWPFSWPTTMTGWLSTFLPTLRVT